MTGYFLAPDASIDFEDLTVPAWITQTFTGGALSIVTSSDNTPLLQSAQNAHFLKFAGGAGQDYIEFQVDSTGDAYFNLIWAYDIGPGVKMNVTVDGVNVTFTQPATETKQSNTLLQIANSPFFSTPGIHTVRFLLDATGAGAARGTIWLNALSPHGTRPGRDYVGVNLPSPAQWLAPDSAAQIDSYSTQVPAWLGSRTTGGGTLTIVPETDSTLINGRGQTHTWLKLVSAPYRVSFFEFDVDSAGDAYASMSVAYSLGATVKFYVWVDGATYSSSYYGPQDQAQYGQTVGIPAGTGKHRIRVGIDGTSGGGSTGTVWFNFVAAHGTTPAGDVAGLNPAPKPTLTASGSVSARATVSAVGSRTYATSGPVSARATVSAVASTTPRIYTASGSVSARATVSAVGSRTYATSGSVSAHAALSAVAETPGVATGSVSARATLSAVASTPPPQPHFLAPASTMRFSDSSIPSWIRVSNTGETLSIVPNSSSTLLSASPSLNSLEIVGAPNGISYFEFDVDSTGDATADLYWAWDLDAHVRATWTVEGTSFVDLQPNSGGQSGLTHITASCGDQPGLYTVRLTLDTTAAAAGAAAQVFLTQVAPLGTTPSGDVPGDNVGTRAHAAPSTGTYAATAAVAAWTAISAGAYWDVEAPVLEATGSISANATLGNGARPPYPGIDTDVTPDPLIEPAYGSLRLIYAGGGSTEVTYSLVLTLPDAATGDDELQFFTIETAYGAALTFSLSATDNLLGVTDLTGQFRTLLDTVLTWGGQYRLALQLEGGYDSACALAWQVYEYANGQSGQLVGQDLYGDLSAGTVPYISSVVGIIAGPENTTLGMADVQIDDGSLEPLPDYLGE